MVHCQCCDNFIRISGVGIRFPYGIHGSSYPTLHRPSSASQHTVTDSGRSSLNYHYHLLTCSNIGGFHCSRRLRRCFPESKILLELGWVLFDLLHKAKLTPDGKTWSVLCLLVPRMSMIRNIHLGHIIAIAFKSVLKYAVCWSNFMELGRWTIKSQ